MCGFVYLENTVVFVCLTILFIQCAIDLPATLLVDLPATLLGDLPVILLTKGAGADRHVTHMNVVGVGHTPPITIGGGHTPLITTGGGHTLLTTDAGHTHGHNPLTADHLSAGVIGLTHQMTDTVGGTATVTVLSLEVCHRGQGGCQGEATRAASHPGQGGGLEGATQEALPLE